MDLDSLGCHPPCSIPKSAFIEPRNDITFLCFLPKSFLNKSFFPPHFLPRSDVTDQELSLQLRMQLRSRGLCSKGRGEKQRECSRAAPALPGWGTLGTRTPAPHVGIAESDSPIPPLRLSLGRSDILQSRCGFPRCYLSPRAAQGDCSCPQQDGFAAHPWPLGALPRQPATPLGSQLFCHDFVCSYSRHVCSNHTFFWSTQNVTCPSKVRFHMFFCKPY